MQPAVPILILLFAFSTYWHFAPEVGTPTYYGKHIAGKAVLLCGASSGIGEVMAYELAKQGARILLVARTESKLLKVKENALKEGSPQVEVLSYDFANVTGAHTVVDRTVELLGGLDYLVLNHAAIPSGYFLHFKKQQTPEYVNRIFSINVFSFIELALRALPHLEKSEGHIFVTSSMLGEVPMSIMPIYSSTKHAINGFFYSLQQELLAKESPVGLTVGALGVIGTDEVHLMGLPNWIVGGVKECAIGMMDSLFLRPRTFTFPKVYNYISRLSWYFGSDFHFLGKMDDYEATARGMEMGHEAAKARGFQVGNL